MSRLEKEQKLKEEKKKHDAKFKKGFSKDIFKMTRYWLNNILRGGCDHARLTALCLQDHSQECEARYLFLMCEITVLQEIIFPLKQEKYLRGLRIISLLKLISLLKEEVWIQGLCCREGEQEAGKKKHVTWGTIRWELLGGY